MKIYKIENHKDIRHNETIKKIIGYAMFNPTDGRVRSAIEGVYGKQQGSFYVAEVEDKIVGILGVKRVDNAYVTIMHIAVEKEHRLKGIAKAMVNYVDQAERVDEIIAEIDHDSMKFYKKLGFKVKRFEDNITGEVKYICKRRC